MNCGCGISFRKPSCDAVHLDRLPQEGMAGILYVIGDEESAAVYVWNGDEFVAVSGDDICCADLYSLIDGTMKEYDIPGFITRLRAYAFAATELERIYIPSSVTYMGHGAFRECKSLTEVEVPDSVTTFQWDMFSGCDSLERAVLPSGLTEIPGGTFNQCSSLTDVTIPDGVTYIGGEAFSGCAFSSINIPNGVSFIEDSAFSSCANLDNVVIPANVYVIGTYCFYGCTSLSGIVIPEGIGFIGLMTFGYCTSLASVDIPSTVHSIVEKAFYEDTALMEIICRATTPPDLLDRGDPASFADVFYNVPANCVIKVPSASIAAYQAAAGWSDRAAYIQAI